MVSHFHPYREALHIGVAPHKQPQFHPLQWPLHGVLFPPPQNPVGLRWTPPDSTGLQLDSVPAKINIGPPKLEDWQSSGLWWTPVQLAIQWTPLDWGGLIPMG